MKLISKYGNEIVITNDEIKISRLKDMGFTEVKVKKPEEQTNPSTKGRSKKNGNKKEA